VFADVVINVLLGYAGEVMQRFSLGRVVSKDGRVKGEQLAATPAQREREQNNNKQPNKQNKP